MRLTHAADMALLERWFTDTLVRYWGGKPLTREQVRWHAGGAGQETLPDGSLERSWRFIIEQSGEPVGYVQLCSDRAGEGSCDMALDPRFHRRGYGRDAIRALVTFARDELGWKRLTVDPAIDNLQAINFWQACGFKREAELPDHPDGPALLMVHLLQEKF